MANASLIARFNDRPVTLRRKETLLAAALRSGVAFPNGCRVGGCGACKCRVTAGEVQELTETGYILSREEIDRGFVLACQAVPTTDVTVAVELAEKTEVDGEATRTVGGRILAQEKVTADITHLTVKLDSPLEYRAGQYANVTLERAPGATRSYSFASPAREDGAVDFYVRRVPGGELSTVIDEEDLVGETLAIEGPHGDFWLRPSEGPLLLVAGGSGLSPILALLEEAASNGVSRAVTLVFGARTEADLYALDAIRALTERWAGSFRFVPVLSEETSAAWTGARGLVTEFLEGHVTTDTDAYLCGPPGMIDAAIAVLKERGVPRANIRFDRFVTRADVAAPVKADPSVVTPDSAGVLAYLRYFLFHAIGLLSLASLLAGGSLTVAGLLGVLTFYILGDTVSGDDTSTPSFRRPWILTLQLWLALPLLVLIVFAMVWSVSAGDPLGFGAGLTLLSGHDFLGARSATTTGQHVAGTVLTGLMIGMIGTIPAHELTHRTWDRVSMTIGRWLLAFSFDTSFAIEHVYGHHRYVATAHDPATARRGRNVYAHILLSTVRGNVSAWNIERERLAKRRRSVFSIHNAFLRGHLMSVALVGVVVALGGLRAAGFFVASALFGKALLEVVNYMEHYGIVRDPGVPVQPRHSWNTNRRISSWAMFNLTRHSHHHAQGEVPYHELRPYPEAPMMIGGYLTTLIIALVPPVWHRLMASRLAAWDRDHATPDERRILAAEAANAQGHENRVLPALLSSAKRVYSRNGHATVRSR